jgi:hypothetical protein
MFETIPGVVYLYQVKGNAINERIKKMFKASTEMIEEYAEEGAKLGKHEVHLEFENEATGQKWIAAATIWGNGGVRDAIGEAQCAVHEMLNILEPTIKVSADIDYTEARKLTADDKQPAEYTYTWHDDWGTYLHMTEWWTA